MHLFLTDFERDGNNLIIREERIVYQCKKVLRMQKGDVLQVQNKCFFGSKDDVFRLTVSIVSFFKEGMSVFVEKEEKMENALARVGMCVSVPNASKKMSLIVQKLTEVGVGSVMFWDSEHSQLSVKKVGGKLEKLNTVALEASEQSKRTHIPKIVFIDDMSSWLSENKDSEFVIFDFGDSSDFKTLDNNCFVWGIVGPEGGFGQTDRDLLSVVNPKTVSLGNTVLRMETAAIVGCWSLVCSFA